jgi:transposase InsO family protein
VEAIPTKKATEEVVMKFLEEKIITRFGVPAKINTDNAKDFSSVVLNEFCFKYGIVLSHSSNYYPQGNGLEESNNKKTPEHFENDCWGEQEELGHRDQVCLIGQPHNHQDFHQKESF